MKRSFLRQGHAACHGSFIRRPLGLNTSIVNHSLLRLRLSPHQVAFASSTGSKKDADRTNDAHVAEAIALDAAYSIDGIVPDLSSTRPIPLHLPEPPHPLAWPSSKSLNPTQWNFTYLFGVGKAYLNLYKTGFKNVWYNWKTMRQIQARIGSRKSNDLILGAIAVSARRVTFNEFELVLRTQRDLKKLLPFGLVLAICGEFTPLVVLALGSGVVPGTCVIPKQQAQDFKKMLDRHDIWTEQVATLLNHYPKASFYELLNDIPSKEEDNPDAEHVPKAFRVLQTLEAYKFGMLPLRIAQGSASRITALPWTMRLKTKRDRRIEEVTAAAIAVYREGGWAKKSPQDMWDWGSKYGLYQLFKYARNAHEKGKDIVSDDMKQALIQAFDKETEHLIENMGNNTIAEGFVPLILEQQSPDAKLQRAELERVAAKGR